MHIQSIPLKEIKIKNRFREDKGDIATLALSIKEKGLLQPITVDQHMNLLAGERRFLAHQMLGMTHINAVVRVTKGIIDAQEVELFENIHRKDLAWFERAHLERSIFELKSKVDKNWTQTDQARLLGHSQQLVSRRIKLAEAMELLPDLAKHKTEDDAFKEYKRLEEGVVIQALRDKLPIHVRNAIERAAEHYIVGDAFSGMAAIADETFHFAEVDPPYGIDLDRIKSRNSDDTPMAEYREWADYTEKFEQTVEEVYRLLKPNSFAVFWYGMSWHYEVMEIIKRAGFSIPDIPAVWTKGASGQTASPDTTLGSCYEPFFLARKGRPVLAKPGRSNVFHFPPLQTNNKTHPTEKPILLLEAILETCIFPGSNVLVPFLGSGVTLRACYRLGHSGLGWDLSEEYKQRFLHKVQVDQQRGKKEALDDNSTDD